MIQTVRHDWGGWWSWNDAFQKFCEAYPCSSRHNSEPHLQKQSPLIKEMEVAVTVSQSDFQCYVHCTARILGLIRTQSCGGFTLASEDLGRMFNHSFLVCTFFFFKLEISLCTLIPLLAKCSLTSCVWAHFGICFNTVPGQWHGQPAQTSLGQGYMYA